MPAAVAAQKKLDDLKEAEANKAREAAAEDIAAGADEEAEPLSRKTVLMLQEGRKVNKRQMHNCHRRRQQQ
jgi:hypothetical protein